MKKSLRKEALGSWIEIFSRVEKWTINLVPSEKITWLWRLIFASLALRSESISTKAFHTFERSKIKILVYGKKLKNKVSMMMVFLELYLFGSTVGRK